MKSKKNISRLYQNYCDKINNLSKSFIYNDLNKTIDLIKNVKKNLKLYYLEMAVVVL